MQTAKIFQSGNSQAVRLPKAFRVDGKELWIQKVGKSILLIPKDSRKISLREILDKFDQDLILEREQPTMQERDFF